MLRDIDLKDFISVKEAAAFLKVQEQTVRNLISRGAIKAYKPVPKLILIEKAELKEFILKSLMK